MIYKLKGRVKALKARMLYRRTNSHISFNSRLYGKIQLEGNNLICEEAVLSNVEMGYGSYVAAGSILCKAKIGRYVSVGPRVIMETAGNHPTSKFVSVHPGFYRKTPNIGFSYVNSDKFDEYKYADHDYMITVGNDVWIAAGVTIMAGIKIGDGAIVAAGALVTNDVPPYAIVGGIPAKILKYRFSQEDIDFLLDLKWWDRGEVWIKEYAEYFEDIKLLKKRILEQ